MIEPGRLGVISERFGRARLPEIVGYEPGWAVPSPARRAELERALVLLGEELAFPAAPDVSERVLARLAEPARPRRRRRALVLALAVLPVAIRAAMAVPQARTASPACVRYVHHPSAGTSAQKAIGCSSCQAAKQVAAAFNPPLR